MPNASDNRLWTLRDLAAVPRALVLLAAARWQLGRVDPKAIAALNAQRGGAADNPADPDLVRRVARVIPAAASIAPWRADCLVQAIAAQGWLAANGGSGTIVLGVDRDSAGIEPHAWLRVGETIVTGGPIDRYTVLLDGGAEGEMET